LQPNNGRNFPYRMTKSVLSHGKNKGEKRRLFME